ncbi:MAG: phosphodiesterase [Panacagrimonas sp.]
MSVVFAAAYARTEEITVTAEPPLTPARGMAQSSVIDRFGEPAEKREPVGGGSSRQPPITRWDYEGFTVIFEHGQVIDSVVTGRPAPIKVREGLSGGTP